MLSFERHSLNKRFREYQQFGEVRIIGPMKERKFVELEILPSLDPLSWSEKVVMQCILVLVYFLCLSTSPGKGTFLIGYRMQQVRRASQ